MTTTEAIEALENVGYKVEKLEEKEMQESDQNELG